MPCWQASPCVRVYVQVYIGMGGKESSGTRQGPGQGARRQLHALHEAPRQEPDGRAAWAPTGWRWWWTLRGRSTEAAWRDRLPAALQVRMRGLVRPPGRRASKASCSRRPPGG